MPFFNYKSKKIYYCESGMGYPVVFLHGNTASSKMFEMLLPLYEPYFKVILVDFLGHGKSDRVEKFPAELWYEEAMQVIGLLEHLNYGKVSLVGTSGGAWVALNVGLERPDLVDKIVADSFDGRTLASDFAESLVIEREEARKNEYARGFYEWCQGEDWEHIVDMDTKALVECASRKLDLFHKPLNQLNTPMLLIGSLEDTMVRDNLQEEYEEIAKEVPMAEICIFKNGGHPALASNGEKAAARILDFFWDHTKGKGKIKG